MSQASKEAPRAPQEDPREGPRTTGPPGDGPMTGPQLVPQDAVSGGSTAMEQLDLDFGPEHRIPEWERPLPVAETVRKQVERQMQTTIRIWESYERKERQKRLKPC